MNKLLLYNICTAYDILFKYIFNKTYYTYILCENNNVNLNLTIIKKMNLKVKYNIN